LSAGDRFEAVAARWNAAGLGDSEGFLALGAVLRAPAGVVAAVDGVLRSSALTRNGYLVLVTLLLADDGTRSHGRLARDLLVHPTTISLVTDQLVADGLVRRSPDRSDRRATLSTITPKGKRLVTRATEELATVGFGFGSETSFPAVPDALRGVSPAPRPVVPNRPRRSRTLRTVGGGESWAA
jgi:DNA-binding MarR family transcriptional regulator